MVTSPRCRMCFATCMSLALFTACIAQGAMTPVSATGWNRDIVVERSATTPYSNFAQALDVPNNYAHYENGLPGGAKGLPQGGAFNSASDPTTQVQLQPYSGPNVLFMNAAATGGTLTLATPAPYNRIAIFASSANASGTSTGT